jgi:hypothetical protein
MSLSYSIKVDITFIDQDRSIPIQTNSVYDILFKNAVYDRVIGKVVEIDVNNKKILVDYSKKYSANKVWISLDDIIEIERTA